MDRKSFAKNERSRRLILESFSLLSEKASSAFAHRNAQVKKLETILATQLILLTGSLALILYLGFSTKVPIPITIGTILVVAYIILKLKIRLIKAKKAIKRKDPPVEVGEILASASKNGYRFYIVKRKSAFHLYLKAISTDDLLRNLGSQNKGASDSIANNNTLLLHKKRVFQNFYKVIDQKDLSSIDLSA